MMLCRSCRVEEHECEVTVDGHICSCQQRACKQARAEYLVERRDQEPKG
jgi:hypothetical protein